MRTFAPKPRPLQRVTPARARIAGRVGPGPEYQSAPPHPEPAPLRRHGGQGEMTAPPVVCEVLATPGQPMDAMARAIMEPRFGHDFGQLRVHTDAKAADSARAANALAYTVGKHMVFGEGQYAPHTFAGQRLLAHELTHTLQQGARFTSGAARVGDPRHPAEQDAQRAARDAVTGRQANVSTAASAPVLQRQPLPDLTPSPLAARLIGSELLDGFALNSAALTEEHKRRLAILAITLQGLLRAYPTGSAQITGHTDASGDEAFNQGLGQRRADAVRDLLLDKAVPAAAMASLSAGESQLLIETSRPEPRNRRVEVRFMPSARPSFFPPAELTPPAPVQQPTPLPRPDQVCAVRPDLCAAEALPSCTSTDCSAVSLDPFDEQPADLQTVVAKSFVDPADWFEGLDSERGALTAIFNRMCRYGLWCHVRLILRIVPGEAVVTVDGETFRVPGSTPSVYFMSRSGDALAEALMATGRFCTASGAGASQHPGQTTLREISGSDSLHVSIGPGDQFDAHIDRYSPVVEHPGSSFCPNHPSPAAVGHIGRELVPEKARKILGIPGVEVFPEPAPPAPLPAGAPGLDPTLISITLRGPVRARRGQTGGAPPLDRRTEAFLDREIPARIRPDALQPSEAKRQLAATARAREEAGPDEERALIAALEAARERAESFADAHEFAKDLARRMDQARRSGRPAFAVQLGSTYLDLSPADMKALLAEIRHIARIVRALLAERAAGVSKIWVLLGENVMWDIDF